MHSMFGTKHIIILVISICLIVGLYFLTRKWRFKNICKSLFIIAVICEVVKTFAYIVANEDTHGGILPKSDLPFQLCSIQLIFIAIVCFSKKESLKRIILSFMLPCCLYGGIAAMLIPTQSSLNMWTITIQYFTYHTALCVFALHLFTNKEIKWTIKDYRNSLIFIVCIFFFAIYINSMLYDGTSKINFMYVVNPPKEGLPYLNKDGGWLWYMIRYALLVLVCITICYIKPIIVAIKEKLAKRKTKNNNTNN